MLNNLEFILRGDYQHIDATPQNNFAILKALMEHSINVIPNTFQQMNPSLGNKVYTRMSFVEQSDGEVVIEIGMDHLKIAKISTDDMNLDYIGEFLEKIKNILHVLNKTEIKFGNARRISLIFNQIYNVSEENRKRIFMHFNKIEEGTEDVLEWKNRIVKRKQIEVIDNKEEINLVNEYGRVQGVLTENGIEQTFDGIQALIDINTLDENIERRIDYAFSEKFLETAYELYKVEFSKIEGVINGEGK